MLYAALATPNETKMVAMTILQFTTLSSPCTHLVFTLSSPCLHPVLCCRCRVVYRQWPQTAASTHPANTIRHSCVVRTRPANPHTHRCFGWIYPAEHRFWMWCPGGSTR